MDFDAYTRAEVSGVPVDWTKPARPADELIASVLGREVVDDAERDAWKLYRLRDRFRISMVDGDIEYPAGSAVLNDGYEVVYLECVAPGRCGQHTQKPTG